MKRRTVAVGSQEVLIQAMSAVIVPLFQQPQELVSVREAILKRTSHTQLRHVATVPATLGDGHEFIKGEGVYDWALMDVNQDPLYQSGRLTVPTDFLARLQKIEDTGVGFDALWIAHELPKGDFQKGKRFTSADLAPSCRPYRPKVSLGGLRMILKAFALLGYGAGIVSGSMARQVPVFVPQQAPAQQPQTAPKALAAPVVPLVVQEAPVAAPSPIVSHQKASVQDQDLLRLQAYTAQRKLAENAERLATQQRLATMNLAQEQRKVQETLERQVQAERERHRCAKISAENATRQAQEDLRRQEQEAQRRQHEAMRREISSVVRGLDRWHWAVSRREQADIQALHSRYGGQTWTEHNGNLHIQLPGESVGVTCPPGDPILFGVIERDGICDLYYLGHWQ